MSEQWSPVLDFEMIEEYYDLFNTLYSFEEEYLKAKESLKGRCYDCGTSRRRRFAQKIRNMVIENNRTDILSQLDPRTIIRYGKKIYRISDLI